MKGTMNGLPVVVAAFEFRFIGGSMGSVVGERFVQVYAVLLQIIVRLFAWRLPVVRVCRRV